MASSTASAPLNVDSRPDEYGSQPVEPKSYAEAVQETPPQVIGEATNGTDSANILNDTHQGERTNGSAVSTGKPFSVLRIIDTNGEEKDDIHLEKKGERIGSTEALPTDGKSDVESTNGGGKKVDIQRRSNERQNSKHDYSTTSPEKSSQKPPGHEQKIPSQKSNGAKPSTMNDDSPDLFEKFQDESNGAKLTSLKRTGNNRKAHIRTDKEGLKAETDQRTLVSGRQAGKGWQRSGIRFAPLNVPLQRRLQTLVVLFHSTCIALSVSTFFFLCAIPIFWPLLIIYMIYCLSSNAATSGTLKYRSNFLRSLRVWSLFGSYFPARLHRSEELPPTRKYIFGYHPHGIISHGAFAAFGTEALGFSQLFPGITNTLLTLDSNFRIPIYRDYALAMGLGSVSRESCENLLSKGGKNNEGMGRAITIVVGGAAESLDAQPYYMRLVLKRRKGFVKMALRTGADLVPVLAFGENDLYDQVTPTSHPTVHKAQLLVKKVLGFTIPLFHARGVFNYDVGLMPYRRPLNIVVGRPIRVTQTLKPQQDEIDRLHTEYTKELESMWHMWKDDFAKDRKGELEILE